VYDISNGSVRYTKRFWPERAERLAMAVNSWSATFRYTEADVRRVAPVTGGVYKLMYAQNAKLYVFYVGQSSNLAERLLGHLGSAEPNACIRRHLQSYTCHFDFLSVSTESERLRVESDTIRQFNPPCNA